MSESRNLKLLENKISDFESGLPDFLTDDFCQTIVNIQSKKSILQYKKEKLLSKTSSPLKKLTKMSTMFFWINKAIDSLVDNLCQENMIISFKIKKKILSGAVIQKGQFDIEKPNLSNQKKILNKEAEILEQTKIQAHNDLEKEKNRLDLYSIASENQIASLTLAGPLKKVDHQAEVLEALKNLGTIFLKINQNDDTKEQFTKTIHQIENLSGLTASLNKSTKPTFSQQHSINTPSDKLSYPATKFKKSMRLSATIDNNKKRAQNTVQKDEVLPPLNRKKRRNKGKKKTNASLNG